MAEHIIRPGKETEFEEAEIKTLDKLKESNGMIGYQVSSALAFPAWAADTPQWSP